MFPLRATSLSIVLAIALAPQIAGAQGLPTISTRTDRPSARAAATSGRPLASVIENGQECTTITFEGLGDLAPVPPISGINSPGWLSLIDEDAGGSGNFANEPSPETVMFWLGSNPSIVLDKPASKIEFYYGTSVDLTVTAFDSNNVQIAQISRPPNSGHGPGDPTGDYGVWTPLTVEVPGAKIKTLTVIGGPNYTGFDNLKVCTSIGVDSVELTQAIQQWQSLDDLKADLQGDREPPVPVVAGKPAVLRVYMQEVGGVTPVTVEVSGGVTGSKVLSLQPQCTVEKQRLNQDGCTSADFYFTPTQGNFDITVRVRDGQNTVTDTHDLPFTARATNKLKLKAVSICDDVDASSNWLCAAASTLAGQVGVLRKIAPTGSVTVETTSSQVRVLTSAHATIDAWWDAAIGEVANLHGILDWASSVIGTTVRYYGMIRPALPGGTGGMANEIGGNGAGSRTSATRLGVETNTEVVAHETGHMLGLRHTNTDVPLAAAAPPGCYNLAVDSSTNWPFANNRIQSAARLEVGFDVVARRPLDPQNTFDIMSYCVPRWISPQRYKSLITALSGGAVTSPSITDAPSVAGAAWLVSGVIANGAATLDPLFTIDAELQSGIGSHVVNVLDSNGAVLASSGFTPASPDAEASGPRTVGPPRFTVVVPKPAGAASLEIRSDTDALLGTVALGGAAPTVQLVAPTAPGVLSGNVLLTWAITDADSTVHTTRVQYSKDNGVTWSNLAAVGTNDLVVNFDELPGGASTSIRLIASDGVNSGTSTFGPFSTPRKSAVTASILSPGASLVAASGMLFLEGLGLDVDDGTLGGSALVWTSSIAGALGTGERIGVNLTPGTHQIQLTATDSDGNTNTAQVTVQVAGPAPQVSLSVVPADTLPTTCMAATIDVTAAGLPPAVVEYSLNSGVAWTAVPINTLPFRFIVPGSGYFNMVARVFDAAGQSTAAGEQFFTSAACAQDVVVAPTTWNAPAVQSTQVVTIITAVADMPWTATSDQPWLTVSQASGQGTGAVTLTAAATTSAVPRTAHAAIAGETVLVTQAGGTVTFVVTPTTWNAPGAGGAQVVTVTSNLVDAPWTASSSESWLTVSQTGGVGSGSVTLTATLNTGGLRTATATIAGQVVAVSQASGAPSDLRVTRVAGNQVTLQWSWEGGPTAGFVVAGGIASGQTLATLPTGSASPIFTFTAPTGRFFVRVHTTEDAAMQRPSNEVPLVVNVPAVPSAPANLLGTVDGNRLDLAWTNTYGGGAPAGVVLQVTGAVDATFPLGLAERFSFSGVPPGTYNLSVVATNAAGASAPSNQVTLTFPAACTGAPLAPRRFLTYRTGRTVFLVWEPAEAGPAPIDYVVHVAEFGLSLPTGGARALSGTVGPGTYTLTVTARNTCGASAPTAAQAVVVP